jgi:sugar phosphate isomerase/epimerase
MKTTRRSFVQAMSMAAISSAFAFRASQAPLRIAFSTIGCPAWDFSKILDFAVQNEFAAIELRGLQGNLDLPSHPIFARERMDDTKRQIADHNLKIACVGSSTDVGEDDRKRRMQGMGHARRFIHLASELESPYVRVFGKSADSDRPMPPDESLRNRVAEGLHELGEYARDHNVTVLLESHDDLTSSFVLREVLKRSDSPSVGLLWDAFHTFATSNEDPAVTVTALRPWIRHCHLKDAVGTGPNRKYVLTGRGNIPVRRQIELLQTSGYTGYYCFEWEKVWHPELEDPEIAIADFAKVVRGYFVDSKAD